MSNQKDYAGLSEPEIVGLVNKKKKRYCAIALSELEEIITDQEEFKRVRKVFLDAMNGYTRGLYTVFNIEIEGVDDF